MTCWPPALIRSGLFGSMPSAMMPTLMPDPFTIWFGGVHVHHLARLGLDQRLGRVARADLLRGSGLRRRAGPGARRRGKIGPAPLPSEAKRRMASGTTAWTAELRFSRLASAEEIVADIASMMWKLAHVRGVHLPQFGHHACLGGVGRLDPRVRGGALRRAGR